MFGPIKGNSSMAVLSLLGAMTATAVGLQVFAKTQGVPLKLNIEFGVPLADQVRSPSQGAAPSAGGDETSSAAGGDK